MSNKNNKKTAQSRDPRISLSRFVDDTFVQVVGAINYPDNGYGPGTPDKLDGLYQVNTYSHYNYESGKRDVSVCLTNVSNGDEFSFSAGEYVTASTFTRVKPRTVHLNEEYDVEVFPGGHVRVGCQDISAKNAEKAALAILTAQGYTFS